MLFQTLLFTGLVLFATGAENASKADPPALTLCARCHCDPGPEDTLKVDCSRQRLQAIPDPNDFPKKVIKLDLTHNDIAKLDEIPSGYDKLEWLSLSDNGLHILTPSAFEHAKGLTYLDLSFNQIGTFHEKQFDPLDTLQTLNFSYCRIERLPDNILRNQNFLVHLDMSHNPLKFLSKSLFAPLNHLTTLTMAHNDIYSLETGTFSAMGYLESLDLSGNRLKEVPTNALRAATTLKELDLSDNPIAVINHESFAGMSSLKRLTLRGLNKLFEIQENSFSTQYHLDTLIIEENLFLTYISPSAFYGMFNHSYIAIKNVSLKRNRLATLAAKTLPFCNLTSLDLRENLWNCDCHLTWIAYCHDRGHIIPNVECASPKEMRAHFVDALDPALLPCDNTDKIQAQIQVTNAYVFYMTFFMMCVIFAVAIVLFRLRYATPPNDKHSSIYYLKAQTEAN